MVSFEIPHDHEQWMQHGTARITMADCPAMRAVESYLTRRPLHWIIVLAAQHRGSGKSISAAWLLTRLEELAEVDEDVFEAKQRAPGTWAMWCDCAGLRRLRGEWESDREAAYAKLSGAWALVLDDVGTERDAEIVQDILTIRKASGLLTICTTNLVHDEADAAKTPPRGEKPKVAGQPMKAWTDRVDARIKSRMRTRWDDGGLTAWCYVPAPDMREKVWPVVSVAPVLDLVTPAQVDKEAAKLMASLPKLAVLCSPPSDKPVITDRMARSTLDRSMTAARLLEHVTARAEAGDRWAVEALAVAQRRDGTG